MVFSGVDLVEQRDGLVARTVHLEPVRRVEYGLPPLGRSLLEGEVTT